jgi:hypothetical protein
MVLLCEYGGRLTAFFGGFPAWAVVARTHEVLAGKITGMLLEMDTEAVCRVGASLSTGFGTRRSQTQSVCRCCGCWTTLWRCGPRPMRRSMCWRSTASSPAVRSAAGPVGTVVLWLCRHTARRRGPRRLDRLRPRAPHTPTTASDGVSRMMRDGSRAARSASRRPPPTRRATDSPAAPATSSSALAGRSRALSVSIANHLSLAFVCGCGGCVTSGFGAFRSGQCVSCFCRGSERACGPGGRFASRITDAHGTGPPPR